MYNHTEIENKWQKYWEDNKTFKTWNDFSKPKYYCLDMFPYPSGAWLHVGHPEWFTANDIVARYKNANGYNVLHPMWWDAFWLPAENYAIKTWTHPRVTTDENIQVFKKQLKKLGFSYDWDKEIDTTDPKYYKWTQWIFLKLFEYWLAYEQDLPINYCPSCKTWLANEEVLNDFTCERCWTKVEKKQIRQWVLAITKYADRLLHDVDKLDWPEWIKDMQRNWIGRSEWCEFEMKKVWDETKKISVYTTRIDTVFWMTYTVIAPDHKDIGNFITPEYEKECKNYIKKSENESDQDRTADNKEKTWVFTWSYVINPYNNKQVPLWIADYVLGNYGTWAVMSVPAHDTRDHEFALKYELDIKQSIAPFFTTKTWKDTPQKDKKTVKRKTIFWILRDSKNKKIFVLDWEKFWWKSFVIWGVDEWEKPEDATLRELIEETGYQNIKLIKKIWWELHSNFYAAHKNENRYACIDTYLFELIDDTYIKPDEEHSKNHKWLWIDEDKVVDYINLDNMIYIWNVLQKWDKAFTDYWILINSWSFTNLSSEEAKIKMIVHAEKEWFWEKKVNYKLRDWLFSRQRYWGEPIPLIHLEVKNLKKLEHITDLSQCSDTKKAYILKRQEKEWENCTWAKCPCWSVRELVIGWKIFSKIYDWLYGKIVCDYILPLELPEVKKYEPSWDGTSPLSKVDNFVNVKLADNLNGKRETNTMPQWGWSCWYYLRFMDNENDKEIVDKQVVNYWGEVDSYVGWAEHAVLHLLYARFWHKFLFDIWVVPTDEPFYRLRNQWLILAHAFQRKNGWLLANDLVEEKNGLYYEIETWAEVDRIISKMSKSLKNVINPDDIVKEYWADSLRLYEMYMAEFKDTAPWDTKSIIWVRRFIEKSERLFTSEAKKTTESDEFTMKLLHKTIKKVWEDIENYKFNTAIAALMILVNNWLPNNKKLENEFKEKFLILLSPFTSHLAEELWERSWNKESIFFASWPKYDKNMIIDDEIEIWIQILWKLRWTIKISKDLDKDEVLKQAKENESVSKWLEWKEIIKEIYVPYRIVNLVVK